MVAPSSILFPRMCQSRFEGKKIGRRADCVSFSWEAKRLMSLACFLFLHKAFLSSPWSEFSSVSSKLPNSALCWALQKRNAARAMQEAPFYDYEAQYDYWRLGMPTPFSVMLVISAVVVDIDTSREAGTRFTTFANRCWKEQKWQFTTCTYQENQLTKAAFRRGPKE